MDILLRTYVTLSILAADRVERLKNDDRGQGTIEYVGMVIVAAAIVMAVMKTKVGDKIAEKFTQAISDVFGGGDG